MAEQNEDIKQNIIIEVKESGVEQATKDVGKLNISIDETASSTKKAEESQKNFKTQLREANAELQKAVQIHGETSKEAVKAAKGVAELKDQMGFAKDLADQFNPDQKFKALTAASKLSATSVSAVTSATALFGEQSKDTEQALLKVQAAMAFSDSISQLSDLGDQWTILKTTISQSTIFQKANSAATVAASAVMKLFGGSAATASVGFKVLKGAIIATGIGIILPLIGELVANFDKIKEVALKMFPALEKVGDAVMGIVNAVTDFLGVTSEASRAVDKQKDLADKALAQNEKYLERNENTLSEARKKEIQRANEHYERVKEGRFSDAESQKIYHEALAKDRRDAQDIANKESEAARKKQDEANKQAAEKRKAERDRLAAEAKAKRDKEKADLDAAKEDARKATEALLAEVNKSIDEAQEKNVEATLSAQEVEIRQLKDSYFQKIELAKQFGKDTSELEIAQANEINDINLKYQNERYAVEKEATDKRLEVERAAVEQKKALRDAEFNLASQGIEFLKGLAPKNRAIQKAAIIAEGAISAARIINSTQTAVMADIAVPLGAGLPKVPIDIAAGALSLGTTIAATSKALQAVGGGSAPSTGNIAAPTRNTAQVGFQASSENQIATSIANNTNEQAPIQAYVTEKQVTTAQEMAKIKELGNKI